MSKQLATIEDLAQRLDETCTDPLVNEQIILQIIKDLGTELMSNLAEKNVGKCRQSVCILHDFSRKTHPPI